MAEWFPAGAAGVLLLLAGCPGSSNGLGPTESPIASAPAPTDSGASPVDSALAPTADTLGTSGVSTLAGAAAPGIPFGAINMKSIYLSTVFTGFSQALEPTWLLGELAGARAKGARVVIKLVGGPDNVLQNADKTFSLTKWRALMARFKTVNFGSYISDGTILGVFLIDEPQHAAKWGGKIIPQATIEEMAKYSKQLFPGHGDSGAGGAQLARTGTDHLHLSRRGMDAIRELHG